MRQQQSLDSGERPVFIVGCARSGTTLLQLMLHAHPHIAVPPETRFVMPAYDRREEFGEPQEPDVRKAIARFIIRRRWSRFDDLGLPARETRRAIVGSPPTLGSMFATVFRSYAARFDKVRWGDKQPAHIERIDEILRLFPDAQIVHIIRDGRDCVASLQRMPWWEHGNVGAIHKWVEALRLGRRARRRLGSSQYHELRYEDLVDRPEEVIEALCDFLGEEPHPAMLEPQQVADEAVPDRKHWHERTKEPVNDEAVRRWEDELSGDVVALMELVAGRWLRRYGYAVSQRVPTPPLGLLADYIRYAVKRRAWMLKRRVNDELVRRRYGHPVAYVPQPRAK